MLTWTTGGTSFRRGGTERPLARLLATLLFAAACSGDPVDPNPNPDPDPDPDPGPDQAEVLLLASDVAYCTRNGHEATAAILDDQEGRIFVAGDMLREHGPGMTYDACYGPTWGRHLDRTNVAMGNNDYLASNGDAAFDYFGDRAGPRGLGYYAVEVGSWLVVVLNSNNGFVPTATGSTQERWLRDTLGEHADKRCVLAVWHHPRFFQGGPGHINTSVRPFWSALYEAGADVVVNGHFRLYERYGPQDPNGNADAERGIRQFIVGTGGGGQDVMHAASPNVEARGNPVGGLLKLTLKSGSYDWAFLPVDGESFTDSGSASCN